MGVNMKMKIRDTVGIGLIASFFLLAGCSSETPTTPTSGGGGGTTTPPVGAAVTITVSNPNPLVASTSTITATVTNNGQPVANGTAVEFSTDFGTFTDTAAATTIRTTTNGVASAILTSATAGAANVTVRVNNVAKTTAIVFKTDTSGGGGTAPTITSITPTTSSPSGGGLVTINGANFTAPVRVLFGTTEAAILSVTPTQIQVRVPPIQLGASQQSKDVTITVITQAGTTSEQSTASSAPFRYQLEILTPIIYTVSPSSGPNEGSTRITIIGEGFQAPVKVFFGTAGTSGSPLTDQVELDVQQVTFNQIIAMTPPALGLGSELANKQVTLRVLNVASNKDGVLALAFRYGPLMRITAVGPTQGPVTGGTLVTINGWGFDDPVAVSIGGVAATVIRVSGTEIVARTNAVRVENCAPAGSQGQGTGITVTNIEDGTTASSDVDFTYLIDTPILTGVNPIPLVAGSTGTVNVANPGIGTPQVTVGGTSTFVTGTTVNPDGTVTLTFAVPTGLNFQQQACPNGGSVPLATTFPVSFKNLSTGCSTADQGLSILVSPPQAPALTISPTSLALTTTTAVPTTGVFNIVNTGNAALSVTAVNQLSGQACGLLGNSGNPFTANLPASCDTATYAVSFSGASPSCSGVFQVTTATGQTANVTVTATATAPTP